MKKVFWASLILAILIGIVFWVSNRWGKLDSFARCLNEKSAKFYGAFWCPHCQNQKSMFGLSEKYLPYIECSTADGQGQLEVCKEKKITGYPTWIFADESSASGELNLKTLAEKTGCNLP